MQTFKKQFYFLQDSSFDRDEKKPPFADHENFQLDDDEDSLEKDFEKPEDSSEKTDSESASKSDKDAEKKSDTDFYFSNDETNEKEDDKEDTAGKEVSCRTVCAPPMDYETCAVPRCDYKVGTIKDLCQYLCHHQKEHCEEVCE